MRAGTLSVSTDHDRHTTAYRAHWVGGSACLDGSMPLSDAQARVVELVIPERGYRDGFTAVWVPLGVHHCHRFTTATYELRLVRVMDGAA